MMYVAGASQTTCLLLYRQLGLCLAPPLIASGNRHADKAWRIVL